MFVRFGKPAVLAGALALVGGVAVATPLVDREPGLWEITFSRESPMAAMMKEMQAALAQMPEAQRKQMEEMMQQSGASLAHPDVIRECVTPEMAKGEFQPPMDDPDMQCSDMKWKGGASEGTFSLVCTHEDGKWAIKGRVWDATARHYKSEMTMTGTVSGEPMNMTIGHEANWVSADCQGVAPRH
ncbi:DUF3617 family protein [Yanghanlia caeni]|uniref:DUF3617 domain-containing protein n=1 Tax=Yanghanlia caeni TaxID=3064283 RepID=A0ABU1D5A8_9BURK|nr:DUF3617 domain-containing protein [Alcaligenaceae bacterium LG-2]NGR08910.1 DUF3617 domain-containing protein [bacterium SGD-2]HZH56198.1 DUF3617 domain-containing protein [Burkholderiaceae bacterium]